MFLLKKSTGCTVRPGCETENQEVTYEVDDPKFADYYRRLLCR